MNERLRELADQALIPFKDENGFECHHFSKEKFAELIIRECAAELSRVPGGYDSSLFYKNSTTLEQHFGLQ
jgi:hypothetical protein